MYRKPRSKKEYFKSKGTRTQPSEQLSDNVPKNAGRPMRDYEIKPEFQAKAFRDMSFESFSMKIDPYAEISYQADPYAVLNKVNPVVDAVYPGRSNISGSVIPQLQNGTTSTFKSVPDCLREFVVINYAYCKGNSVSNADSKLITDTDITGGKREVGTVNQLMVQPFNDVLESISAEAYYDLPFFKWKVPTTRELADHTVVQRTYTTEPMIDVLLNYQSIIQAVATVPLRYRVLRSLEKHLKDMCYMNGSEKLNSMFGYAKKAAFVNQIKGVSETLLTQYLDDYWYNQISMLVAIPCRKANDMLDPLIDVIPEYKINANLIVTDSDNNTIINFNYYVTLMNAIHNFLDLTSPYYVLNLARDPDTVAEHIREWSNNLIDYCGIIVDYMQHLETDFKEMITAFKRMAKVGFTEWKTGKFVNVDKLEENYEPKFNKLIFDIVRSGFTGGRNITYNLVTNKWNTYSLWDKYLGLPTYDYISGGSILTFSTKRIVKPEGTPSSIAVPVLCYGKGENGKFEIEVLTRDNTEHLIEKNYSTFSTGAIARVLGRLVPLTSADTAEFLIPECDITLIKSKPKDQAWIINLLVTMFGYGKAIVDTGVTDFNSNSDALCFIDLEIDDLTNAIQTFCRQHSPFRTIKASVEPQLGFITKK